MVTLCPIQHLVTDFLPWRKAQATALGASSPTLKPGQFYTDSSMERFNRGGTQEDGGTPYYGPLPETMEQGTPLEPGTPMETPIPPTQPDKEDGEQGHHDGESSELPPSQQLSYSDVDKRLRRIMTPRANGDLKVPQQVIDQWKNKNTRPDVMSLFEKSGYQPDWVRAGSVQILVGFVFMHRMFGALQSIFCYLSNKTLNL